MSLRIFFRKMSKIKIKKNPINLIYNIGKRIVKNKKMCRIYREKVIPIRNKGKSFEKVFTNLE